jgi:hypothetical protein
MAVKGCSRNSQPLADRPQRQTLDAIGLDGANRFLDQGPAQVAVMVTVGPLALWAGWARGRHG